MLLHKGITLGDVSAHLKAQSVPSQSSALTVMSQTDRCQFQSLLKSQMSRQLGSKTERVEGHVFRDCFENERKWKAVSHLLHLPLGTRLLGILHAVKTTLWLSLMRSWVTTSAHTGTAFTWRRLCICDVVLSSLAPAL